MNPNPPLCRCDGICDRRSECGNVARRYDGTSRPAPLAEALPNPPDPAVGVSDTKAVCIAGALFTLAIIGYIGAVMAGWL